VSGAPPRRPGERRPSARRLRSPAKAEPPPDRRPGKRLPDGALHRRRGRALPQSPPAGEQAPGPLEIVQPEGWAAPQGYANGVAGRGRLLLVAGQVGWDPLTGAFAGDDLAAQAAQALANVLAVLRAAGGEPRHLARLTWYVADRAEYLAARPAIGKAYRALMGRHYPAMSLLVVHSLLEERAKVEIEATALIPDPEPRPDR
jgi:enamine deaminase RidA (YjgF/YER057c/UK114 family)